MLFILYQTFHLTPSEINKPGMYSDNSAKILQKLIIAIPSTDIFQLINSLAEAASVLFNITLQRLADKNTSTNCNVSDQC